MEREISGGAMLGIVMLALAAVIGIGFGIFSISKSVANEGSVEVQDSLNVVSDQVFLDYDQKVITGAKVIAGAKYFEGKPYAVLISTNAFKEGRSIAPETDRPKGAFFVKEVTDGSEGVNFINYNAIIAKEGGETPTPVDAGRTVNDETPEVTIHMENGAYIISDGFATRQGNIIMDNQAGGAYKDGNAEYILNTSKFQANVIKDDMGNYAGIALEELKR